MRKDKISGAWEEGLRDADGCRRRSEARWVGFHQER